MCYTDDARPPDLPGGGGAATGEDVELTAADGNRFAAYVARPEGVATAGLLIYPDIRGLHGFYKALALRCAEAGIAAVAMDYFGRTAGPSPRDDAFEHGPHVEQLRLDTILADARAALARVRDEVGEGAPTYALGFCLGGSTALYTGAEDLGLSGVVAFYAGFRRVLDEEQGTALDVAPRIRVPVLGLFGGADQGIPVEQVEALDEALDGAGVAHEVVIYPGAPHSFFDRRAAEHAEASADAWRRVLAFVGARTADGAA